MSQSRLRLRSLLLIAAFAVVPGPARSDDAPVVADADLGALAQNEYEDAAVIAGIEHTRGDPSGLDRFLTLEASHELRRRAIVALGRIGARTGVEPRLRALLERGGKDLSFALWAAGLSGIQALVPSILPHVDRPVLPPRGWAIYALGDVGDRRADGYVLPLLAESDPSITVPASYAALALGAERGLESMIALAEAIHPELRAHAVADAWRLAGARKKARSTNEVPWAGDVVLARRFARWATRDPDPEVRVFAQRALSILVPIAQCANHEDEADPVGAAFAGATDADPRVVADVASRFLSMHEGAGVVEALWTSGYDADPLVRETVAATLAAKPSAEKGAVAQDLLAHETDARVRLQLAIAVAACGQLDLAKKAIDAARDAGIDAALVGVALSKALGSAKDDVVARTELLALGRDEKNAPIVREAVMEAAGEIPEADAAAYGLDRCKDSDPVVRASAASLVGDHGAPSDAAALAAFYDPSSGRADQDFRASLVEAIGKLALKKDAADAVPVAESLIGKALGDPAPSVRLAARAAAKGVPSIANRAEAEDAHPNEWKGLPRPKGTIAGIDLSKGEGSLSELEIVRLADAIRARGTRVRFETDAGAIEFTVDALWTPVHAVNLVLAAAAGVYDGTLWHRVVPAFVIQGGDPRGDGFGDAGYSVPDEIAPHASFLRGTLGMPKSTKDTGGCQVFVMHMSAPHLDQHYTAFGQAVSGIEVVDRIRVGDRIRKATLVENVGSSAK